jgi:diguanylate cyclase (GGDEF)-like protein/PAS domain S-box-containing protein
MDDPVKALILDDNAFDAELSMRELRRSGGSYDVRFATREHEFRSILVDFAPDVILCDFAFPDFDGLAALQIARELTPDTPLIFVSGTISEERAVIAVQNGAVDYVLKGNLVRLPHAVARAVDQAREKARRCAAEAELDASRERLETLLHNVDSALSSYSLVESRYHYFSPAAERVYGRSADEFYRNGRAWYDFVHPDDAQDFLDAEERLMANGQSEMEYRVVHPDGSIRWVSHRSKVAHDAAGTPIRIDTIGTDITERKEEQRQLDRLSRIRDVFAALNSAIVRITDSSLLCREACRIASAIGGFPIVSVLTVDVNAKVGKVEAVTEELESSSQRVVDAAAQDPEHAGSFFAESLRRGRPVVANDLRAIHSGAAETDALKSAGVGAIGSFPFVIDATRKGALVLGVREQNFFNDEETELVVAITNNLGFALELAAKRERLDYLAYYDPLTELPNRTLAQDRLGQELAAAERRGDHLALLVFDIRRFSYVNTTLGDAAGDEVLRTLAARLRERVGSTRVARVAGDRFAIIIPELRSIRDVTTALSSEGLELMAEPFRVGERELRLTAHVGCAVYPSDGTDALTLFRNAEAALQSAKAADAPHLFYAPELNQRLERRLELEARLRRAAAEHQFVLYYQPKVELRNRTMTSVEALIRWQDPERPNGLVPPGEFIPVLEETGLIVEVGRWAIGEAVRQHHAWLAADLAAPRIAVNVSPVQLADARLVDDVSRALAEFPADSGLDIEVTESGVMANIVDAIETLRQIRELGVGIALDDFGTGHSSLSYIFQLPLTTLKIDRSFINGMTSEPDKLTIVSTVISLGRELRLQVVAEGVETEEQAKLLGLLRCDQIQGFLIGRPMPAEDLARLLKPC